MLFQMADVDHDGNAQPPPPPVTATIVPNHWGCLARRSFSATVCVWPIRSRLALTAETPSLRISWETMRETDSEPKRLGYIDLGEFVEYGNLCKEVRHCRCLVFPSCLRAAKTLPLPCITAASVAKGTAFAMRLQFAAKDTAFASRCRRSSSCALPSPRRPSSLAPASPLSTVSVTPTLTPSHPTPSPPAAARPHARRRPPLFRTPQTRETHCSHDDHGRGIMLIADDARRA